MDEFSSEKKFTMILPLQSLHGEVALIRLVENGCGGGGQKSLW